MLGSRGPEDSQPVHTGTCCPGSLEGHKSVWKASHTLWRDWHSTLKQTLAQDVILNSEAMQLYHIYAFLPCPISFVLGFVWGRGLLHSSRLLLALFHQRIYLFFNLGLFQAQEERVACIRYSSWTQVWAIFPHFSPFTQFINLDTLYPVYIILLSLSSFLFISSLLENTCSLWIPWSFMHYDKMHYLLKKKKKGSEVTAVTYR